jgi:uncharacterized protein
MPVALITGASAGIGKEFARLYAAKRYDLVLVARRADSLAQLADELSRAYGVVSHVIPADLADPAAPTFIHSSVSSKSLQIDVLVNNAGFGFHGRFSSVPVEKHMGMIQVNISSLVHLTRLFLPEMVARKSGGVMNVASTAAFVPGPMMSVYYATKAFVLSFSEALWNEMRGTGVSVSCLCPGATITEFQIHSGMDKTDVFKAGLTMDATTVARMGIEGLERNQSVVICGLPNKIAVASSRLVPRKLAASLVRRLQDVR